MIRLLLGLAVTVLLAGAAMALSRRAAASHLPSGLPLVPDKSLGVNADLSRYDTGAREQALTAMESSGLRWVRQRFAWDRIEPARGQYDWAEWDNLVAAFSRHNLRIVAVLDGTPQWARAGRDHLNPLAPPEEVADFGAFAAALARRFGDQIDHYQIWEEPNISPHWGAQEISPQAYVGLLREGAIQARSADPGAVILLAALAPNVEMGGANMSELQFLDALYQHHAAEWFDVVAGQPYDFGEPLSAPAVPSALNWARLSLLRGVMESHGDAGKPLWAVSFGLQSMDVVELSEALELVRREWPWVGPMLWAAWAADDPHGEYALYSGTPALVDAAGQQDGSPIHEVLATWSAQSNVAWPGAYPADHPSGHYEGNWRVTRFGSDIGRSGDRLTIAFRGTRIDLKVRRGDYRAFLFVTVDGRPANALPLDTDGRSYVVLYDPLEETPTVTLARGIEDGEHTAEIVAERGWGQWAVLGWNVLREEAGPPHWPACLLGLGALTTATFTAYQAWPRRRELLGTYLGFCSCCRQMKHGVWLAPAIVAGAAILAYGVVGTVPSLLAIGLLASLLVLWPGAGLPVVAAALPFYQLGKPLLGKTFSMVEILIWLTLLAWVLDWCTVAWASRLDRAAITAGAMPDADLKRPVAGLGLRPTDLDWGVLALLLVGLASLLWAEHGRVAAREYRTVILGSALFYGLLRIAGAQRQLTWPVADAWLLGGAAIALVGLWQWAAGQDLITAEGVWRVRGFYGSPNNLALYLGRLLPLAVSVAAWYGPAPGAAEGGRGRGATRRRLGYGFAALLIVAALLLTHSRGAWLLGVPVSLLFLAAMRGRRVLLVGAAILALGGALLLVSQGPGRLSTLLDPEEGTTFFRLQLWRSSWAMIREHPLLGVGLDNFLYWYRTRYVLPTAWQEFNLSHPHNLLLDFWLRLGLPGLVTVAWLLVAFFRRAWRAHRSLFGQGRQWPLAAGLVAGMVNFLAHGLVDNAFFLVDLAFVFMLMLALVQQMTPDDGRRARLA